MEYSNKQIADVAKTLKAKLKDEKNKTSILRATELKALYAQIPNLPEGERANFGAQLNALKNELKELSEQSIHEETDSLDIDVTAPFDINVPVNLRPRVLTSSQGSRHPINREIEKIIDIYLRMGFEAVESRQIDNEYNMFESLNFPPGHPARDDYDTFTTTDGLIAPAHTSTMQNRILSSRKKQLENGEPIAVVIPGRVFRNEDIDATHEHTFYQLEGVYVDKNVNVGNLIAVLKTFMSEYFGQDLKIKIQPFYFPFTEPSFEFAIERPEILRRGDSEAEQWLELLGCGLIHPNVLEMAGINPKVYSGFAWGGGIERLVMLKYEIDDIRHFESGKIEFLRQFGGAK